MSAANNTNTILLHANGVRSIDNQTLSVDVPGGTLTLIFASRDVMRNAAAVIIVATDRPAPGTPINVDEVAATFQESSISLIPRIPAGLGAPEDTESSVDTEDEEETTTDLPTLLGDGGYETDETVSVGDIGLTQELNF